jgi:predicted TIM-barrel fold metal-dependent hydrolase
MKKIAIEEHYSTESYVTCLRSRKCYPKRELVEIDGKMMERECAIESVPPMVVDPNERGKVYDIGEVRLKDMDEDGIDMQVLSLSYPGIEPLDASEAIPLARRINDEIAEKVKQYPDRFAAFAVIASQDPKAAADELERSVSKLGFKGAMINGHIRGEYLDDEKYWVIFDKAVALDVPIYIHPREPAPYMIRPYLAYPMLAFGNWGFGAEAGLHIIRLLYSGVLVKYPNLKIILGHLGEALPFWLWRIDSRGAEASKFPKSLSQYFKENFYVTTSGMFWEPVIQFVCSVMGADRVLFAVDYPYESGKTAIQVVESISMSDEDKEKIFHGNAERLLKI